MPSLVHVNDDRGMIFIIDPIMKLDIDVIDREHAKLIEIINELNDRLQVKAYDQAEIDDLFDQLIHYAVEHFFTEALLFKEIGYTGADKHNAQHEALLIELIELKAKKVKMIEILRFLVSWLNTHTVSEDKLYVEEVKAHIAKKMVPKAGIEPAA